MFLVTACSAANQSVNKIEDHLQKGDIQAAVTTYEEATNNDDYDDETQADIQQQTESTVKNFTQEQTTAFKEGTLTHEDITTILDDLHNFDTPAIHTIIDEERDEVETYQTSIDHFHTAKDHSNQGNYLDALEHYEQVTEETETEYTQAQEQIEATKEHLYNQQTTQANESYENHQYQEAYEHITTLEDHFQGEAQYEEQKDQYLNAMIDDGLERAVEHTDNESFREAILLLEDLQAHGEREDEIAEQLTETEAAYEAYQDDRKDELLAQTNEVYDDMTGVTYIAPQGYAAQYIEIDRYEVSFYPRIIEIDGDALFGVVTGFHQDSWLFYESIMFNVDGDRFEWMFNSYDRNTDIGRGIYEWYVFDDIAMPDLLEDVEKIANGEQVDIRFVGEGFRDYTLTDAEKEQFTLFLELYEYYDGGRSDASWGEGDLDAL